MPLTIGARLGPYEVVSALGTGGMGEVYKARDTRLDRTVAIKVLPSEVAGNPDLRARFEREARAVAALDHPHICGIYDVGSVDGTHYLVMPHLEGQTLAARLEKGPLPLDQALKIATEIADALDKAHRQGIIHRDLKPANIFLARGAPPPLASRSATDAPRAGRGRYADDKFRAILLDFGLAKLRATPGPISMSGMTQLPTRAPETAHGTILGTVQYMAPEQVEGREADARSDIWALGVVIYEMVTGMRPFQGETPASIIGAILKDEPPPISARQPLAPLTLDRMVSACLAKDADERWQSAHDLKLELLSIRPGVSDVDHKTPARGRWRFTAAAAVVLLALGAIGMWARRGGSPPDGPRIQRATRLTNDTGFSEWPTWSPDGKLFAYSSNRTGNYEIHVRRVGAGEDVNVSGNVADDVQPAFSPDGMSIAFVSTRSSRTGLIKAGTLSGFETRTYGGDIWLTPALGGQAQRLAADGNFPVWHPDGGRLVYVTGTETQRAIFEVSVDGGQPTAVLPATASRWEIVRLGYSPNARWITFETSNRDVFVMPAHSGTPALLFRGSHHVWDPGGSRIYYVNQEPGGGTRLETAELRESVDGLTTVRTAIAGVSMGTLKELAFAGDAQHMLAVGLDESLNLSRVPLSADGTSVAGPEEQLSQGQMRDRFPSVSPDNGRIVVSSNRIGENELWLLDLSSYEWKRLLQTSNATAQVSQACWATHGQHLAVVQHLEDSKIGLHYIAIDGSSSDQLRPPQPALSGNFSCAVSPDGHQIVYAHLAGAFDQLFVFDLNSRTERQLTTSPSHKYQGAWSPDGRWMAFSANTGGTGTDMANPGFWW